MGKVLTYFYTSYYANKGIIVTLVDSNSWQAPETLNLIKQIKAETEMGLLDPEAYQICITTRKTEKITGDVAEVGVYKGGSAKLICETTKKPVHLFDTFEGLPDLSRLDNPEQFKKGDYSVPFESVKNYLKNYPNVHFYKGLFPSTAGPIKNKTFSFVHLDVDLYESTLDCLEFFYPRMNKGGVIISHDYPGAKGVKKAFDEFFGGKPEMIISSTGCNQCLVIKV